MKRTKQDYLNLLQETIDFYGENPEEKRAEGKNLNVFNTYSCEYKTEEGKKCAFGRCMDDDMYHKSLEGKSVRSFEDVDSLLQVKYQGYNKKFWQDLQGLHDFSRNWNFIIGGLSEEGKEKVKDIKNSIDNYINS